MIRTTLQFLLATALASSLCGTAAAAPVFRGDIPFRSCEGLICIDIALDGGKPRTLMLDTGNVNSTLLTDVAKELAWPLHPLERDGKPVPGLYKADEHRVGVGALQDKTPFYVFDRAMFGEHVPPVDGSLAYTFFKDRVLEIDYPRHRVRISDVVSTPLPDRRDGNGTLKLITFGERGPPVVVGSPFTLDGKPLRAQIDTVFTGSLVVYDSAVEKLGLTKSGAPTFFGYTDGGVSLLAGPGHAIGLDKRAIDAKAPVYFVGEGPNPVHQPDGLFEATVGNALFEHSVLTLDFHAMTVEVKPSR